MSDSDELRNRIPVALRTTDRWVLRDEKKAPRQINGWYASSVCPSTWTTFDTAANALAKDPDTFKGLGLVVCQDDDLVGLDLDKVDLDGRGPLADEIRKRFAGTYMERSPSGRGVRIWCKGRLPWDGAKNDALGLEAYQNKRYLTCTGDHLEGSDVVPCQDALDWLVAEHFKNHKVNGGKRRQFTGTLSDGLTEEVRDHLKGRPGTQEGRDASGACLKVAIDLVHGFDLDPDDLVPLMCEWGEKDDQVDASGMYKPWAEREIAHKLRAAANKRCTHPEGPGYLRPSADFDAKYADQVAAAIIGWPDHLLNKKKAEPKKEHHQADDVPEYFNQKPKAPKKRRGLSLDEIEHLPAPDHLVRKHITRHSMNLVAGPAGAGKSYWALEMALSMCSGRPMLGQFKTKPARVAYIYSEGQSGLKYRARAWRKHTGVDGPLNNFKAYPYRYDLLAAGDVSDLLEQIREDFGGTMPDLVIIDTLARNFGPGDENKTQDMGLFVRSVDTIREAGPAVLVVHHSGRDASRGERGSSALRAAADTVFLVDGSDGVLTVSCSKMKDGTPPATYHLSFVPFVVGTEEDGEPIQSAALEYIGTSADTKASTTKSKQDDEVLKWVRLLPKNEDDGKNRAQVRLLAQNAGMLDPTRQKDDTQDAIVKKWMRTAKEKGYAVECGKGDRTEPYRYHRSDVAHKLIAGE